MLLELLTHTLVCYTELLNPDTSPELCTSAQQDVWEKKRKEDMENKDPHRDFFYLSSGSWNREKQVEQD